MPSVSFYFQVHQPWRLRPFSYFDIGAGAQDYFDERANRAIFEKVGNKCYLPANRKILELVRRFDGRFRVAYSVTGTAIDQMRAYLPAVLDSFRALAETGCVEFLGETYYHSLASIYHPAEFADQVAQHSGLMQELFGQQPKVFRNTELIYDDAVGRLVAGLGFRGIIAEGADDILGWRSPNFLYQAPGSELRLLLKNYRLSDDIAFRFSDRGWTEWPLTSEKFSEWVHRISGAGELVNLFMDYETFGEHQWDSTGIFDFLDHLPQRILAHPDWDFLTPSEAIERYQPHAELSFPRTTSWADQERDLTAWRGNAMQTQAFEQCYGLADEVRARNNPAAAELWRRMQTSDHFYYMCTKFFADGDVHTYFSPYDSPYDAFINCMNVLTDFRDHVLQIEDA